MSFWVDNTANELVSVLNSNRTAHKASLLADNQGLACIALQYIKAYQGKCEDIDNKKPADSDIADTFAPSCGVQASTLTPITGRLIGCQSKYISAPEAFSTLLVPNSKGLDILYGKNHTEVGAAVKGTDGGSPYFWCVLFSNGKSNSTQGPGCFSGTSDDCSNANGSYRVLWLHIIGSLVAAVYALRF
ncbi:hypothetical protein MKW94_010623 [Papaver nudicaule]|uniref:Ferredoxin-like protein n=1 Tax=Papaver nudicaule TaxID=74823 RepID=A0AA42AV80_PAPNU|nr:hypothetical protein [Papaver nudicaule]